MKFNNLNIDNLFILGFKPTSGKSIITLSMKISEHRYVDLIDLGKINDIEDIKISKSIFDEYDFEDTGTEVILDILYQDIEFFEKFTPKQLRNYFLNNYPEYII